jgi:hypothetical protein
MFFYPLRNGIDAGGTMQIRPCLGNSRLCVIRSFRSTKRKGRAVRAARAMLGAEAPFLAYFREATGPREGAGSGSKPNTPTRYL